MGSTAQLIALIAVCVLFVVLAIVVGTLRSQQRLLRIENDRWRTLARERADRVAMLSHELRTPLSLIGGSAEVLADGHLGDLAPRQAALVETIMLNANTMVSLSEDILADAKVDTQMFTMRTQLVNMRRLARHVLVDLRVLYPNRLFLECRGYPPYVPGDPQLLRQVLINLVTNAARHGGPQATISLGIRRTEDSVLLSVSDDGSGMTPAQRKELFNRTLKGKSETGNGLGMIITQRIIHLHGGYLLIDTEAAHGTTVIARLPGQEDSLIA